MMPSHTPFWVEGMTAEECDCRVSSLFMWLEKQLSPNDEIIAKRTFVFVPDPPPLTFAEQVRDLKVRHVSWGMAGRAAITDSAPVAAKMARVMFNLWPDLLYVLAFRTALPDGKELEQWLEAILLRESDVGPGKRIEGVNLPDYALMVFDWGDLVGTPPVER